MHIFFASMIKNLFLYKPFKKLTKKQSAKLYKQRNKTLKIMQKGLKPYTSGEPSPFLIKKEPNWIRVQGGSSAQANKFMRINRLRSSKSRKFRASLQLSLVSGLKRWFKLTKLVRDKQMAQPGLSSAINTSKTSSLGSNLTGYSPLEYSFEERIQASWNLLTALEIVPGSIWVKMGFTKNLDLSKQTILAYASVCTRVSKYGGARILNYNSKSSNFTWDLECLLKKSMLVKRIPIP